MSRSILKPSLLLAALPLAACSMLPWSHPAPKGNPIADAEDAVRNAERARVGDYDAAGLRTAQRQLAVAQTLSADPNRKELAGWIAEQAVADADLTVARAQRARIFAYYDDLRQRFAPAAPEPSAPPAAAPAATGGPTP